MTTTSVYDQLIDQLASGEMDALQQGVLEDLRRAYPSSVSREQLVLSRFGYKPADISRDVCDRKVRKAIESLRTLSLPIVSSSGEAGYRLDVSEKALNTMKEELLSRISRLTTRVQGIERALYRIRQIGIAAIPHDVPKHDRAKQPSLWGG